VAPYRPACTECDENEYSDPNVIERAALFCALDEILEPISIASVTPRRITTTETRAAIAARVRNPLEYVS
jgi:hypothetical protein